MSQAQAQAQRLQVRAKRDKDGKVQHTSEGDQRLLVVQEGGDVKVWKRSDNDKGRAFIAIPATDATGQSFTLHIPLPRNVYAHGAKADVDTATLAIVAEGVTFAGLSNVAPAKDLDAMIKAKDLPGLTAFYAALPGMTAKGAAAAAAKACR